MADTQTAALILAAGMGTRMKSEIPKVLHPVAGQAMLERVLATVRQLGISETYTVIGHGHEKIKAHFAGQSNTTRWILQEPQRGTGDAVRAARASLLDLASRARTVLVLSGDVPLLQASTLVQFLESHTESEAKASIITTDVEDATHYGRIIRKGPDGHLAEIVENKDATGEQRKIREINTGIYAFDVRTLIEYTDRLTPSNKANEYYLTDVFGLMDADGIPVHPVRLSPAWEFLGINHRKELSQAEAILRERKTTQLMLAGVTIHAPATCTIDDTVEVGPDSVIFPNVSLYGSTKVGRACQLRSGAVLHDVVVDDRAIIKEWSVLEHAIVGPEAQVGPFAHLRPGTKLGRDVRVGNFVEVKNSTLGDKTKASHLTYLGDSTLGGKCNIGAGTITCNYDGFHKNHTTIGDNVFIGSDVILVAPISVGKDAFVAAGSTITHDVPDGALAIARERQVDKAGYRAILEEKHSSSCQQCRDGEKHGGH